MNPRFDHIPIPGQVLVITRHFLYQPDWQVEKVSGENEGQLQLAFRDKNRHEANAKACPESGVGLDIKGDFLAVFQCNPV